MEYQEPTDTPTPPPAIEPCQWRPDPPAYRNGTSPDPPTTLPSLRRGKHDTSRNIVVARIDRSTHNPSPPKLVPKRYRTKLSKRKKQRERQRNAQLKNRLVKVAGSDTSGCKKCKSKGHTVSKCPDKNFIGRCAGCGAVGHRRANCPARQEEFNRKFERLFNGDSTLKQVDLRKAYLSRKKVGRKWRGGWINRRRRTRRHQWRTEVTCPKDVRFKTEVAR